MTPPSSSSSPEPGVGDVGPDVHEALAEPPERDRGAERIAGLEQEGAEADRRDQELPERAAERAQEVAKGAEDDMPGLVERQVHHVQERCGDIVPGHRREDEPPTPDEQERGERRPPPEADRVGLPVLLEQELRQSSPLPRLHHSGRHAVLQTGEHDPAPRALGAAVRLRELALGADHPGRDGISNNSGEKTGRRPADRRPAFYF